MTDLVSWVRCTAVTVAKRSQRLFSEGGSRVSSSHVRRGHATQTAKAESESRTYATLSLTYEPVHSQRGWSK